MCGFVATVGDRLERDVVPAMLAAIRSRGPDESRLVRNEWFSLGVCRLAIVEVAAGAQPVISDDRSVTLAFNGELYDFRAQARAVEKASGRAVDSEARLLLLRYLREGPSLFDALDGDFAVIVFDSRDRTCRLARDHFGVKPLYYAVLPGGGGVAVASEIRGLLPHPELDLEWDEVTLAERRVLTFSARHRTPFRQIRQVQPGHRLDISVRALRGKVRVRVAEVNHAPAEPATDSETAPADTDAVLASCEQTITAAIIDRVTHTDVEPVVVALSGGIDSSIVAAAAARSGRRVVAVTVGTPGDLDSHYAGLVAKELGIDHHVHVVTAEDVLGRLPHIVLSLAGAGPAYTPYFLGEAVRRHVPEARVMLCGEGADEMFAGYWMHLDPKLFVRRARERWEATGMLADCDAGGSALLAEVLRWATDDLDTDAVFARLVQMMRSDQLVTNHLVSFDHATMAHGVECRVPFLDSRVLQLVTRAPELAQPVGATAKPALRLVLADLYEGASLRDELLCRIPSGAPMATQNARIRLREVLATQLPRSPLARSWLARFSSGLEELFWLGALEVVFLRRRGAVDGMTFEDLLEEVQSAGG